MFGQNDNRNQQDSAQIPDQAIDNVVNDQTVPASTWQHPGLPIGEAASSDIAPAEESTAAPVYSAQMAPPDAPAASDAPTDLMDIKQQALSQLTPLVGHLEQSPEEQFRTTMMLIQASDNQALVKDAYAAASAIPDEKIRAQALLDIVNEINYFTQQHAE
jgi:hypothetical protein